MGIWFVVDNGDKLPRGGMLNGDAALRALEDALSKTGSLKDAVTLIEREMRNRIRNQ